jgi:hypothetical protein
MNFSVDVFLNLTLKIDYIGTRDILVNKMAGY